MSSYDQESLSELFMEIFSNFDILEAGNVTINDIFSLSQKDQYSAFKNFLIELKIWGSYTPLKVLLNVKNYDLEYNHMLSIIKLNEFLKRFKTTVDQHKESSHSTAFS